MAPAIIIWLFVIFEEVFFGYAICFSIWDEEIAQIIKTMTWNYY